MSGPTSALIRLKFPVDDSKIVKIGGEPLPPRLVVVRATTPKQLTQKMLNMLELPVNKVELYPRPYCPFYNPQCVVACDAFHEIHQGAAHLVYICYECKKRYCLEQCNPSNCLYAPGDGAERSRYARWVTDPLEYTFKRRKKEELVLGNIVVKGTVEGIEKLQKMLRKQRTAAYWRRRFLWAGTNEVRAQAVMMECLEFLKDNPDCYGRVVAALCESLDYIKLRLEKKRKRRRRERNYSPAAYAVLCRLLEILTPNVTRR